MFKLLTNTGGWSTLYTSARVSPRLSKWLPPMPFNDGVVEEHVLITLARQRRGAGERDGLVLLIAEDGWAGILARDWFQGVDDELNQLARSARIADSTSEVEAIIERAKRLDDVLVLRRNSGDSRPPRVAMVSALGLATVVGAAAGWLGAKTAAPASALELETVAVESRLARDEARDAVARAWKIADEAADASVKSTLGRLNELSKEAQAAASQAAEHSTRAGEHSEKAGESARRAGDHDVAARESADRSGLSAVSAGEASRKARTSYLESVEAKDQAVASSQVSSRLLDDARQLGKSLSRHVESSRLEQARMDEELAQLRRIVLEDRKRTGSEKQRTTSKSRDSYREP
ncbi:MAG: hypothetical protein AAF533_14080 [Acidobacteriota bacterium]